MENKNNHSVSDTNNDSEDIVSIKTFLQYFTHLLKLSIYANKGTTDDKTLERMISLHNKFKKIETETHLTDENEKTIRLCIKRFNLVLKVDAELQPLNLSDKTIQLRILDFNPVKFLSSSKERNIKGIVGYGKKNKIDLFQKIPLAFILVQCRIQGLIWEHIRALFYISQMLFAGASSNDKKKQAIYDESLQYFASCLEKIEDIEKDYMVQRELELDDFLKNRLFKGKITDESIGIGIEEVKKIFAKRGLNNNPIMDKLMTRIVEEFPNINMEGGNLLMNVKNIAENIASELLPELQNNPESLQTIISEIPNIVQDLIDQNEESGNNTSPELTGLLGLLKNVIAGDPSSNDDIAKIHEQLGNMIGSDGQQVVLDENFLRTHNIDPEIMNTHMFQNLIQNNHTK